MTAPRAGVLPLSRRLFSRGLAAGALAATLPRRAARADGLIHVRRSIADLARDDPAAIESYRRAVAVMMARDAADKTGWRFQANMVGVAARDLAGETQPLHRYWQQNPRRSYFFLAWQRMHLYFFERIVRRASGDPVSALPYWAAAHDPQQATLPAAFRPGADQRETPPANRRNALARAQRNPAFEFGNEGARDLTADVAMALALDAFTASDPLMPGSGFGGVRVATPGEAVAAGAAEALHDRLLLSLGRDGDLASPATAARDPVYILHAANIDRLWVQWSARGGVPPVDDDVWMTTRFTFVDENGDDRVLTGADVLDTQFQLGYRYDDDPRRAARQTMTVPAMAAPMAEPLVLARATEIDLAAHETAVVLAPVPPPRRPPPAKQTVKQTVKATGKHAKAAPARVPRTLIVLRDVVAPDRAPAYDLALVLEGSNVFEPTTTVRPLGSLEFYGGTGRGDGSRANAETLAFDATEPLATFAKMRGFNLRYLRLLIVRRPLADAAGGEIVPEDPMPPEIGAIELVRL